MAEDSYPLNSTLVRNLHDKLYDKRKMAAQEIEKLVREYSNSKRMLEIERIISLCGSRYCDSPNCHVRKGGLIGLAACSIALGNDASKYAAKLLRPAIRLLVDLDSRVRYYACESLFNTVKVLGDDSLEFFYEIFDALSRGSEDGDKDVRKGCVQLDRMIRDVVTSTNSLDIKSIIPLIRERVYTEKTAARLFLVNWIITLETVPNVHMVTYLPDFLEGLFRMLDDSDAGLIKKLTEMLNDFLKKICDKTSSVVNHRILMNIVIFECMSTHAKQGNELRTQTTLLWMREFLEAFKSDLLPFTANILTAILPFFGSSSSEEEAHNAIEQDAHRVNSELIKIVQERYPVSGTPPADSIAQQHYFAQQAFSNEQQFENMTDFGEDEDCTISLPASESASSSTNSNITSNNHLNIATNQNTTSATSNNNNMKAKEVLWFLHKYLNSDPPPRSQTKLVIIRWMTLLMYTRPMETFRQTQLLLPLLSLSAIDPDSNQVSCAALNLACMFSSHPIGQRVLRILPERTLEVPMPIRERLANSSVNAFFLRFMYDLLRRLDEHPDILEARTDLIINQLCLQLPASKVFIVLAEIIQETRYFPNQCFQVRKFNRILLSSSQLTPLRAQLKTIRCADSCHLFSRLYHAWSHNPVSLLSLCLLTQNYQHASLLIKHFGEVELSVDMLVEIDTLIMFFETPVFSFLRMHLLNARHSGPLLETMYSILMLLPQSEAFHVLRKRLRCVPNQAIIGHASFDTNLEPDWKLMQKHINFDELLKHFRCVQEASRTAAMSADSSNAPSNGDRGVTDNAAMLGFDATLSAAAPHLPPHTKLGAVGVEGFIVAAHLSTSSPKSNMAAELHQQQQHRQQQPPSNLGIRVAAGGAEASSSAVDFWPHPNATFVAHTQPPHGSNTSK